MNKKSAIAIAAPYFKSHPKVLEFHVTADEQVFENKTQAANHAKTFAAKEDQVIATVNREDDVEASEVLPADNFLSVPAGATIICDQPETLNIMSSDDHVKVIRLRKNTNASDTKETDVNKVNTSAESIDNIESTKLPADATAAPVNTDGTVLPGASVAQTHGKPTAKPKAAATKTAGKKSRRKTKSGKA